jgi:succinoglycan biosynthesis protein ExoV
MKMFYFKGKEPNFGDELNPWLWPQIFGSVFDDSAPDIFIGIGSTLHDSFEKNRRKIVFGAGYGGYRGVPDVHDGSWDIMFVRGPQTAEILGIDPGLALTDSAILVGTVPLPPSAAAAPISFMPHFESLARGNWEAVCESAGIQLIDPRSPVEMILAQIKGTDLLLTEAMHGAILADTLRIRWVPLLPIVPEHRLKWTDWTRSVRLPYEPAPMVPSSTRELWIQTTGGQANGNPSRRLASSMIGRVTDAGLSFIAARHLRAVANGVHYLSTDATISELTERAQSMAEKFRVILRQSPVAR